MLSKEPSWELNIDQQQSQGKKENQNSVFVKKTQNNKQSIFVLE